MGGEIGKSQATATIIDNDAAAGTPVIGVGDAIVDEKAGRVSFTVTLDRPETTRARLFAARRSYAHGRIAGCA